MSTAVADVSGLLEAAASPSPAPTETTVEETPTESTVEETSEKQEATEGGEGAEKTDKDSVDARTNPDAIRKALKTWRDSSPENAPIARKLNYIVGHEKAYTEVWPTVAKAKEAKFLLDSIGGGEGLSTLQNTIKSVNETDAMLYAGDPRVLDNILEDMKKAGKVEAFGKLASPFLDKLRETDEKSYFTALRPHFFQGLIDSGFPDVLTSIEEALGAQVDGKPTPNVDLLKRLAGDMRKWFTGLDKSIEAGRKTALDPDRQAFEKERTAFQTEKQKAFQTEVNSEWNRSNNQALGEALKPFLKLPFAKNWTDKTKVSVAQEITRTLLSELEADKSYQAHMDGLWSEAKPDKGKILSFHKNKLNLIANTIVQDVLDARYPGFSSVKGAPVKPAAATPAQPAAAATPGKPVFQSSKPVTGDPTIDWDRTTDVMYATGRFYKKGEKMMRTWNAKFK
jgi:hypothetical protein